MADDPMEKWPVLAPERFVAWMSSYSHVDRRYGHVYRYHSRSDAHSVALCTEILRDLLHACPVLREQAERGQIVYGINTVLLWPSTGKTKTLDLAVGTPAETTGVATSTGQPRSRMRSRALALPEPPSRLPDAPSGISKAPLADAFIACEAKSVMTEHSKSKPRVYDELSSSHEIVHQGRPDAIATGITVVNIAETFVSPLRQTSADALFISQHRQPTAAGGMIQHLRGLPIREVVGQVGFDAYATIVVESDNRGDVKLWTEAPAPQPGDRDHYQTFLDRISQFYTERFTIIPR
jgi:hypothetical protein